MEQKFDKKMYKELKEMARKDGVNFFSVDLTDLFGYTYNGVSIAYGKTIDSPECRMTEVAVSYCAPEDKFKSKKGKFQALYKMFIKGETIKMPLEAYRAENGNKELRNYLSTIFQV